MFLLSITLWVSPVLQFTVPSLARLQESENCRAKYSLPNGEVNCTPRLVWLQSLTTNHVERVREEISGLLKPHDPLGITRKLLLNEKTKSDCGEILRQLGFVHILTATGIHLYALVEIFNWILGRAFSRLGLPFGISMILKKLLTFSSWIFLWLLAGARPGLLRPWVLVMTRKLALNLGFRWRLWSPFLVCLCADGVAAILYQFMGYKDAWAPGRWIYALSVAGGMMTIGQKRFSHLALAIGSWVFAAIFEAWENGSVSVLTPLLSVATLPVFCFVLFPGLLLGSLLHINSLPGAESVFRSVGRATELFISSFSELIFHLSYPLWIVSRESLCFGALLAGLLIVTRVRTASSKLGITIIVILALRLSYGVYSFFQTRPTPNWAEKVEQLDVGQGDAALVSSDNQKGLIDTGSAFSIGISRWFHDLGKRGVSSIDWVALTHLDEDHAGGIAKLSRIVSIGCVSAPKVELLSERGRAFKRLMERYGISVVDWDSKCIPFPHTQIHGNGKRNQNMGVILVPFKNGGFYLSAGDADAKGERTLTAWISDQVRQVKPGIRILKISHHGSRTSSSNQFLDTVAPTYAWISVGRRNRFHHPSAEVLDRLVRRRILIRRTDRDGTLSSNRVFREATAPHLQRGHLR